MSGAAARTGYLEKGEAINCKTKENQESLETKETTKSGDVNKGISRIDILYKKQQGKW